MNIEKSINLLCKLISTPSFSREESLAADIVEAWLADNGCAPRRIGNNIVCFARNFARNKPVLMLNSHIDTVKPSPSYSFHPFTPFIADGKIHGLGSNDAGGSVVALIAAFLQLRNKDLPVNLMLAISAEEEVGGENGMRLLLKTFVEEGVKVDMAIVGEPTAMQPAIAERGLIVIDCSTKGIAGHAARSTGENAIYRAIADIDCVRSLRFLKESEVLGPIKLTITQIEGGTQHNVIPDSCRWVIDVRPTEVYSNADTVSLIQSALSEHTVAKPRSLRLQASVISREHPLVRAALRIGLEPFVSPTTSDISQMHGLPAMKIGPGRSERSHTADEFIFVDEIAHAIETYCKLIENIEI